MIRNLVLSGGPAHDFAATSGALVAMLARDGIVSTVVDHPADAMAALRDAGSAGGPAVDLVTVNALRWGMSQPKYAPLRSLFAYELEPRDAELLTAFVNDGGAILAIHTAVICFDGHPAWRELCGATWGWDRSSHPPQGAARVAVSEAGRVHPITAELDDFVIDDEVYGFLDESDDLVALLTGRHGGRDHPLLWAREIGAGRVVTDLLGHGPASFAHPAHQHILVNAARWATNRHKEKGR